MTSACIIDTNLLVLLIVGTASQDYITKHKRTQAYTLRDYHLLLGYVLPVEKIVVTPNVLSEASNLLRQFKEPGVSHIMECYKNLIESSVEIYTKSRIAARTAEFRYLGLTDAALLEVRPREITLLTDDFDLYQASLSSGRPTINFSHEREKWLGV